jgi:hypothetical protein
MGLRSKIYIRPLYNVGLKKNEMKKMHDNIPEPSYAI